MAKKNVERTFRIAVVGLSGDEKIKGSAGVGKSCLCNRFVRPHADHFYKDHISIISQIDFSGQVINNDHFLYWGEVTKDLEDGSQVTCSIVELTEFIDDQSFQPLRGHGDKDYKKRCKTTLTSAEKLMYICKDQLGDERNYERKIMPDGKFVVDGFIVVFDVSHVQNRPPNKQSSYIMDLLSSPLHKSKKPCVLVATKCEEPESTAHEEVKSIRDKKKITLIETSAFENVNVDFAFLTLVNLIDRSKRRPMEVPFITGIKRQKEILDKVEDAYMALLSRSVTDYHAIWNRTRKELADEDNYLTYLRYFGKEIAAKKFKNHIRRLKEAQQQKKKQQCLETLPLALRDMLPDLASIGGRDWRACQEIILKHPNFHTWFVRLPDGDSWKIGEYLDSETKQIALDFLKTNAVDCERCFKAHDDRLKEALKRERMKVDFGKLLYALNDVVLPGRQLEDTLTHLVDEESYKYLSVAERKEIYDAHQFEITEQAKKDFVELLLELVETFEFFDMNDVNAHMEGIIKHSLQKEERYKNLDGLIQERRLLLMKHAAFVDNPCRQTCPFQHRCMDDLINQLLEQRVTRCSEREPQDRWSEPSTKLNLVILGENGLADELANEIRAQSVQEEYTLDNVIYSLELRPIDGDVQRPQNNLCTPDFTPQGCICTFSSPDDLRYVTESLRKSNFLLTSETQDSIYATLQPEHPVILLFARDLSIPESDIAQMRHDINKLAEKLFDCTIIDIPTDEAILWHGKKFHETQIHFSIKAIVESNRRSGHDRDDESHDGSQCDPNLRLEPSLYDTIVGSNNKVHSFLSSGNGTSTPSSRGSDDVTSGPSAGSGPPTPAAKAKRDLTQSQSQFKSNSPALKRKNPPVKTPSVGEGSGWEDMISDDEDNDEPVMSIGMAMMCGDPNLPELVLGPIVSNDTCCRDLALKQTVNVDMFLNTVKRRVSIEITSFHQAKLYTEDIHHGYILVYSAKRRASFETLKFFVQSVTPIPIEIVAVSDSEKFSSDYEMQALITEGNKLADETKNCTFITAGANFGNQSLAYSTFFTDAYEKMAETETIHEGIFGPLYDEDSYEDERQGLRTPVETPQSGFGDPTYAKPQIVKGVVYPYPPDKRSDDVVYDQPERFATSPRRFPNNKNEGFVENIIYDRGPGNGTVHYASTQLFDAHSGDAGMVRNPIYDSAEGMPQYRPKPAVPPKPLNMANYQHVAEKLSKPRDPIGGGGAGLVRPNHLPFTGTTSTTPRHPLRAPLATPEKGVFSSPMEAIKHALGVGEYGNSQDVQARGMRQRGNRGHAADDGSGDVDPSDPTYAAVIKKPGFDKVVNEFEKQLPKGNTSSDSDSKGSAEADRYHPHRKKRGSFRKRKNKDVRQGENNDNSGHQDDGTYAEVVFSPGVEGVDPKVRNRQLREEEKNRKKEEKRKQAADKKMVKAQKRQQPKQRQKSNKKNVKKPPAYAPYLDTKPKGEALETLVTEEDPVPKFVKKCIEFIDREGVGQEGIYRVSGKQADCDALTVMFKEDPNISIEALDISCHAVASAVKAFFKNLPDPLIPREQQAELLQMFKGKSTADFLDAMPEFFNKLSPIRLATLRYLMQHFGRVSANSEVNKMAAQNLTVCWWPTLLHPEFKSLEEVANESQLSAFVEQWVQHSEKLFGVTNACPEPETETEAVETEGVEWQQEAPEQAIPEDPMYAAVQPRANAEVI
ncbi:rho GTPase-activating protein 5-like isoform X22 [Patiria miniata]|uniref:Rho GTPase-activating protein 5 n=1 Tax=Patiria miniata TaxID=46514 RepID=A0A913ZPY0_PATMI|nr:rho GTPase-activating protein 5-like isoform X22 [Patiria miniata]